MAKVAGMYNALVTSWPEVAAAAEATRTEVKPAQRKQV